MIDTHCHLLSGLDDGPRTLDGALALAECLVKDGVRAVVATPHYSRRYRAPHPAALEGLQRLTLSLRRLDIPLEVSLGGEISPPTAAAAPPERLAERAIAGRFLLVEAEPNTSLGFFPAICKRLGDFGLVPVIAHPERCAALRRAPRMLTQLRAEGAIVQVVAPSLVGGSHREVYVSAWHLVEAGQADLVASDAHGVARRPPLLSSAAELVERRVGSQAREEMFREAPARLIQGIHPRQPAGTAPATGESPAQGGPYPWRQVGQSSRT